MSDALTEIKAAARKAAFARRREAHSSAPQDADQHLRAFLAGHRGRAVAGYMPIRTEIDPRPAMAEACDYAPVGVPVIAGPGLPLWFAQWTPDADLVEGPFGAMIPADGKEMIPEIVIVPLVAFDQYCNRLGYGGGFYDRTLQGLRARGPVVAAGFAYAAQQAEALPIETTDQRLDFVITERGIIQP